MKIAALVIAASLLVLSGCSTDESESKPGLIGISLTEYQSSTPGLEGTLEAVEYTTSRGINIFGMAPEWTELETAPNTYSFQDPIVNPLTLLDPEESRFRSFILVLKVIDTNRKTVPIDLAETSFGDAVLVNRFLNLIDALAALPSMERVSHILIGNEVDAYLSANSSELNAFSTFYQEAVNRIHVKMPWIKVGTIITFYSAATDPVVFNELLPISDFVCYTYYPVDNSNPNWQMLPPEDVVSDINLMATLAGSKTFGLTEIGYASSVENNSSEAQQEEFIELMFKSFKPYKDKQKLEFLYYHGLYDYPPDFCESYAESQGVDPIGLCSFMNSLGLKSYETGEAKSAWVTFEKELKGW